MRKTFHLYTAIWIICLALFNVIAFITPNEIAGVSKFAGAFWAGYIFITIGFVGHLICAWIAFNAKNPKRLFYNIPLIAISYSGLAVMLVVGGLTMAIPYFPNWIGIIVCMLVLGLVAISALKARIAAEIVSGIDEKTASKPGFIRSLTVDAQSLVNRANAPMLKEQCKKVYEALRYSDPVSTGALADIEGRIKEEVDALADAVLSDDLDATESCAKELLALIEERNTRCKLSK